MGVDELQARLDSGPTLILDGAVGTELDKMGVPVNGPAWCASALSTHPDTVRRLHQDYIDAGADIITANSYASSPHNLEAAGLGDRAGELNALSVQLVREGIENAAPDRSIWIAGSLSSFGIYAFSRRNRPLPPFPVIEESYRRQAHTLAEAGADFLLLEMIREPVHGGALIRAALETGLPVWVGLSCALTPEGDLHMLSEVEATAPSDIDFLETLEQVMAIGGSLLAIMHSEVHCISPGLRAARSKWKGPLAAYANSGIFFAVPQRNYQEVTAPETYVELVQEWITLGARVVGGCCGIGRDHIRLISNALRSA